jgi:hypothetical protein
MACDTLSYRTVRLNITMSCNPSMTWRYWLNEAWLQLTCRHPPAGCVTGLTVDGGSWWLCTRCSRVRIIAKPSENYVEGRDGAQAEAAAMIATGKREAA